MAGGAWALTSRMKKLKYFGAIAAFMAISLLVGSAAASQAATSTKTPLPAAAIPFGMTAAQYKYMQAQEPLDAVATQIEALTGKSAPARNGFFDTEVLPLQHTLIVYWHGAVPAAVGSIIARAQGSINVRVVQTNYSLATLNQEVQQALRVPGVSMGYPQTDGSGIVLGVRANAMRPAAADLGTRITVPASLVQAGADVPQTCVFSTGDTLASPSRCNDYAPFWGGDVVLQYAEPGYINACTGGFGVHNSSGATFMMVASHCAYNGTGYVNGITFYNGNDNATLGKISDVPGPHDGALISANTQFYYYDGPGIHSGDTNRSKSVAGYKTVSVNDSLCESGAFGGVHCGYIVHSLNYTDGTWVAMALATSPSGVYTIDGDSGGPWFSLDGSTSVWAKGIHHGLASVGGTEYEVFTPISILLGTTGTSVNTG
jgi:hypothetical protein